MSCITSLTKSTLLVMMCAYLTLSDNFTNIYKDKGADYRTRQHRLLTFNALPDDDISVELDFAVPFIRIPVKPDMDKGVMANLNIGAIALAGMMAFGAAFVIPATYHLLSTKSSATGDNRYRSDDMFSTSSTLWKFMANIDRALTENNIDSTSCTQRALCWTVHEANNRIQLGTATSTDKIIDGLASHTWIAHLINGSVFQAAIQTALRAENCAEVYKQCRIDQNTIQQFAKQLIHAVHSRK